MILKRIFLYVSLCTVAIFSCNAENRPVDNDSHVSNIEKTETDFWMSLEEAVQAASVNEKYILIDIYAEWCGFCRKMLQETYADSRVQEALLDYFYPVRLDAESTESVVFNQTTYTKKELALAFGAVSYPTTVFLDNNAEPIAAQGGYIEEDVFRQMLLYIGTGRYKTQLFEEFIEE